MKHLAIDILKAMTEGQNNREITKATQKATQKALDSISDDVNNLLQGYSLPEDIPYIAAAFHIAAEGLISDLPRAGREIYNKIISHTATEVVTIDIDAIEKQYGTS